jgi:hypothetical protein
MRIAVARRSAMLTTLISPSNSGKLRIYAGTRPANSDTSIGGATLLAELTMNATSFTESAGVLTANAITSDSSADATGTAAWARLWQSDGTTPVADFGVTTSAPSAGSEVQLNTTALVTGAVVSCSAFTISLGVGA